MKTEYETVSFAGITLSPDAQKAIHYMQVDMYKAVCENLDKIAFMLCQNANADTAMESIDLIQSILASRNLIYSIGCTGKDDEGGEV